MRALERFPKVQATNGIMAYQQMRYAPLDHSSQRIIIILISVVLKLASSWRLAPFAASGKVVTREDVRRFFEEKKRQAEGRH